MSRFLIFTLLIISASCGNSDLPTGPQTTGAWVESGIPSQVVVIGPSTAETLLELGLRNRIAAVSDFCVDPRADGLPRIGGQFDPNLERITALNPDLIIVQGGNPKVRALCKQLQIRFLQLHTDSLSGWFDEVRQLSKIFDAEEVSDDLLNDFQTEIARFKDSAPQQKPGVAILIGRDGARSMIAVGSGSFLHELLEIAGGQNVFASNERGYFDLAEEALLQAAPEFLFDLSTLGASASASANAFDASDGDGRNNNSGDDHGAQSPASAPDPFRSLRKAYPQLPAVKRNQLYALQEDYVFLPGPRMLLTMQAFRDRLTAE